MANPPARIGPYEVQSRLGVGGMAETYLALRRGPGDFLQHVCLKRIRPDLAQDPEFVQQFMTEAAIAARLRHNAITQVLDFGQAGDDYYLALELVDGLDLRQLLDASPGYLAPELVLFIAIELATALDFAHRAGGATGETGVVHRDVSASNVLISTEGEIKLSDFGIARVLGGQRHTRTGIVKGKVAYMAPEYARSGRFDSRCDLFALGVLLYECVCGARPHEGATELETLELAAGGTHEGLAQRAPELPAAFAAIVERLLAPDPEQRFQSAGLLLEALLALPSPQRARRTLGTLVAESKRTRAAAAAALIAPAYGPTQPLLQATVALAEDPGASANKSPSVGNGLRSTSSEIPGLSRHRAAKRALAAALVFAVVVLGFGLLRASGKPAIQDVPSSASAPVGASAGPATNRPGTPGAVDPRANSAATTPAPDGATEATGHAKARTASLEVVVLPYGDVSVDGRRIGISPVTLALEPGEHAIQAKNAGGSFEKHISLTAGERRQIVLR